MPSYSSGTVLAQLHHKRAPGQTQELWLEIWIHIPCQAIQTTHGSGPRELLTSRWLKISEGLTVKKDTQLAELAVECLGNF